MPSFTRRILIVEDDNLFGSLMMGALQNQGFETKLATSALEAKRALGQFDPDVAVVDIDLGQGLNGIDFVRVISRTRPEVAAILLTKHPDASSAGLSTEFIPDGVAYLRKTQVHDTTALVAAIDEAARGRSEKLRHDRDSKGMLDLLTKTQIDILHQMALGLSNKQIAKVRGVSLSSVEQRVSEIFKAFNLSNDDTVVPRVEAIRRYIAVCGIPDA